MPLFRPALDRFSLYAEVERLRIREENDYSEGKEAVFFAFSLNLYSPF